MIHRFSFSTYNGVREMKAVFFMRHRGCSGIGVIAVAFGSGLVMSYFCTSGLVIAILTIALIVLGIFCKC